MTTYYIDSNRGNDSNDGLSWSTPKASIGGVLTLPPVDGDVLILAPGDYNESIVTSVNITIKAHQRHTATIIAPGIDAPIQGSGNGLAFEDLVLDLRSPGTGWFYKKITIPSNLKITNCVIRAASRYPIISQSNLDDGVLNSEIKYNVFDIEIGDNDRPILKFEGDLTFIGNTIRLQVSGTTPRRLVESTNIDNFNIYISDNIFYLDSTTLDAIIYVDSGSPAVLFIDHNVINNSITANQPYKIRGTTYNSLAALQTDNYELHGVNNTDPQLGDIVRGNYNIPKDSILATSGTDGARVGAWNPGVVFSENATDWSNWTANNCVYVAGQWMLGEGATTGTVTSPVIDLVGNYEIVGLVFSAVQIFPTNVVDVTNTGVSPEELEAEIRMDVNPFSESDPTPPWQEVNLNEKVSLGTYRYVQVRFTLRKNGA